MKNVNENQITVKGQDITYYRIDNDVNGNPRYVTHFLSLGVELEDYGKIPGLTKYRGKWFGGGYVHQSYNLENTFEHALDTVQDFYKKKGGK
jgi:hypothetical protein